MYICAMYVWVEGCICGCNVVYDVVPVCDVDL